MDVEAQEDGTGTIISMRNMGPQNSSSTPTALQPISDPHPVAATVSTSDNSSGSGQSNSKLQRFSAPFRSLGNAVKSWEMSAPTLASSPRGIPDTVYVREVSENSAKQVLSEDNGEMENLLSADEKEDVTMRRDLLKVRTKEEEHQLLLRALQKRFVCPNYAVSPRVPTTPKPSLDDLRAHKSSKSITSTGHMRSLSSEKAKEVDQIVTRLEDALSSRQPPFDTCDHLLDKFSVVQQKQLVLNYANLELAWSKNVASGDDEHGSVFRGHLTIFQEMMDELSKDVLVMQGIDPRDSSDALPRRNSSDQPDLQALHAKLFHSQNFFDASSLSSVSPFAQPQALSSSSIDAFRTTASSPTPSTSSLANQAAVRPSALAPPRSTSKTLLSEPPSYPPPPVPPIQ